MAEPEKDPFSAFPEGDTSTPAKDRRQSGALLKETITMTPEPADRSASGTKPDGASDTKEESDECYSLKQGALSGPIEDDEDEGKEGGRNLKKEVNTAASKLLSPPDSHTVVVRESYSNEDEEQASTKPEPKSPKVSTELPAREEACCSGFDVGYFADFTMLGKDMERDDDPDEVYSIVSRESFKNDLDEDDVEEPPKAPGTVPKPWMKQEALDALDDEQRDLWVLFDTFDKHPEDGVLNLYEFKLCMMKLLNKDGSSALTEKHAAEAFVQVDTNNDNAIDFTEFQVGFKKLQSFLANLDAQKLQVTQELTAAVIPGLSSVVDSAESVHGQGTFSLGTDAEVAEQQALISPQTKAGKTADEEAASTTAAQERLTWLLNWNICLLILYVLYLFSVSVALWIGVAYGKTCDQPLRSFSISMATLTTLLFSITVTHCCRAWRVLRVELPARMKDTLKEYEVGDEVEVCRGDKWSPGLVSNVHTQTGTFQVKFEDGTEEDGIEGAAVRLAQASDDGTSKTFCCYDCSNTMLQAFSLLLHIGVAALFFLGLYWFEQTGGVFGFAKGDCLDIALHLWSGVYWYYVLSFVFLIILLVFFLVVFCATAHTGSAASLSMQEVVTITTPQWGKATDSETKSG
jgi:hypothetical protein